MVLLNLCYKKKQFYQNTKFKVVIKYRKMCERDFVTLKKLGQGSFGQVYKVKRISDMNQYAMKKVKILDMKQRDKNNALNQIRLLASLEHQNIIAYKQAFYDQQSKKLCTIMELAENGDLSTLIKDKYKKCENFYEFQIWSIGRGILKGLEALHQAKVLHRDLKPANIFFGKNDVPKIGDMNVSIFLNKDMAYTQTGTPYYASPEVWNNDPYSFQCDIWSFGCMLYEMCTFKPPFKAKNMDALYEKIQRCQYQKISKRYSPELEQVISLCLRPRNRRAKISQLMRLFEKFEPPKSSLKLSLKKCKTTQNLLKTIKMPSDKKEFSKILPKSKYKVEQQSTSNQADPETLRQSSTSLGKRQQSVRKSSNQQNSLRRISIDRPNVMKPLILGSASNKSLRRLEKNPSTKKLLDMFSPKKQPSSQINISRPRSYLQNIPSMKSEKYLKKQEDYLREYISLNQNPSFKNILQSPKITNVEKLSVERLNLKRRKLRMALNY